MVARQDRSGRRDGFALVAVLALTGLLAGLLATMSTWARSSVETAAATTLEAETDALLRAGVDVAGFELFARGAPAAMIEGQRVVLDSGTITISVTDDGDKIDLNGSSAALLAVAYRAAGLHAISPQAFAARVLDWRDLDNKPSTDGAEDDDYRKAGRPGPRNGPFHSVADLGWVLGVSPTDLAAIRPFVTVLNPGGKLDPYRTSRALISALPDMKTETLEKALAIRQHRSRPEAMDELRRILETQSSYFGYDLPAAFRLNLEAISSRFKHKENCRIAVIRSYDPTLLYRVAEWTCE